MRKPRNIVSSRSGARTPVITTKEAVLPQMQQHLSSYFSIKMKLARSFYRII